MKIKINEIDNRAIIELTPKEFALVRTENEDFPFGLAYRIDMSKPDQTTEPVIFLTPKEAEKLQGIF
jgi:hypothetical protein